jgi:hypothetical protein
MSLSFVLIKQPHAAISACGFLTFFYMTNLTLSAAVRGAPIQPALGAIVPR